MKKWLIGLLLMAAPAMAANTPRMGIDLVPDGATNWGNRVRANWNIVDSSAPVQATPWVNGQCVTVGTNGFLQTSGGVCGVATTGGTPPLAIDNGAVRVSSPTSDVNFSTTNFNVSFVAGSTAQVNLTGVILSQNILQAGSTFYVSSGTIAGPLVATGTVTLGSAGNSVTISSNVVLPGATYYQNAQIIHSSTTFVGNVSFSASTYGIVGTTNGNNATAGNVGEYISSSTAGAFINAPATSNYGDLLSINLTAGAWNISANIDWTRNGATWTDAYIGISATSGNSAAGTIQGDTLFANGWASTASAITDQCLWVPVYRVSIASPTTYYLKIRADYSAGGPPQAAGRISAIRAW